jgi:succinate dehydrogenase/fumarate reductase cytochrome b subunit
VPLSFPDLLQGLSGLSFRWKLLIFASLVVTVELAFRRFAPRSAAYHAWQRFFEAVGSVWTAVILAVVYFVSVSLVAVGMRLFGKDPLDRSLRAEPSFWRAHEPNPLGIRAAARHQF